MNKMSVCDANNPMPTGHGEAGAKLLSPSEDGRYNNHRINNTEQITGGQPNMRGCMLKSITSGFVVMMHAKS